MRAVKREHKCLTPNHVYVSRVMTFYSAESREQGTAVASGAALLRMPPPVHLHSWQQVVFVLVCASCLVLATGFRLYYMCAPH